MSLSEPDRPGASIMAETLRAVAHPWHCDLNGHVNTRYHQGWFDDASFQLLGRCGFDAVKSRADGIGAADVKCTMQYSAEIQPGTLLVIRSGFTRLGSKSFTSCHELRSVLGGNLFAECETVSVFLDLVTRSSRGIPDAFRMAAEALLVEPGSAPSVG